MKRYNINWTIKGLYNQMLKGNINFDNAVQRSLTWDIERKSLLIHSCLYGYSIPALYFTRNENGGYDSLDGKQRSNALYSFLNDEYALVLSDRDIIYDDEENVVDVNGLKFSELPEWAQDRIKDYSLTIYYYDDMTEDEIHEFFRRLNNGKPLTAVELTRVKAKSITAFQTIAKHEAIQNVVTDKGKARFNDENIAMQIYATLNMQEPDFGTKAFRPWICEAVVSEDDIATINTALDKVGSALSSYASGEEGTQLEKESKRVLRKLKSRTNFVSMVYLASLVPEMSNLDFGIAVWDFFNVSTTSISNDYNATVGAGSAKSEAIKARKAAIEAYANKLKAHKVA